MSVTKTGGPCLLHVLYYELHPDGHVCWQNSRQPVSFLVFNLLFSALLTVDFEHTHILETYIHQKFYGQESYLIFKGKETGIVFESQRTMSLVWLINL